MIVIVHRKIEDIEFPRFLWQKVKGETETKPNLAFDTETINGKIFLIADSTGLCVNDREFNDLSGLLQLLNSKRYRETTNWFYNLEYDTNALLKFLNREDRKHIAEFNFVDYEGYRIEIIPRKELKISKIKGDKVFHTVTYFDLAQFYFFKKLAYLALSTKYRKVYVADISQISSYKYYNDKTYHKLINDRCVIDCKITVAKADDLTNTIYNIILTKNFKSNASIGRKYVLYNLTKSLKVPSIAIMDKALKTYHAGFIETCKLGLVKGVHNLDIKSAYPYQIAQLEETDGVYVHNKEYEPDAAYSYYFIKVDYDNAFLSPIWFMKGAENYHINGNVETWVSKSEMEYFINCGIDVKILEAYHLKKTEYSEQPFYNIIHDLYKARLEAADSEDEYKRSLEKVIKIILNSIYGVTLNVIHKKEIADYETDIYRVIDGKIVFYESKYLATNMYNPLFGTDITARTRVKIFNDFKNSFDSIIAISTDGVYQTKKNKKIKIGTELGSYGYNKLPSVLFMGSGRYFIYDKDDSINDGDSRFRGLPLKPSKIEDLMVTNKNKDFITTKREKPIKLKESLKNTNYYNLTFSSFPIQNVSVVDEFNVFNTVKQDISFKNQRRFWYDEINNISDLWDNLYESRPFNVDEVPGRSKRLTFMDGVIFDK